MHFVAAKLLDYDGASDDVDPLLFTKPHLRTEAKVLEMAALAPAVRYLRPLECEHIGRN